MRMFSIALALTFSMARLAYADTPEEIWKSKCKACHGDDGKAQTKVGLKEKIPDMTNARWQSEHDDAFIKKTITEGSDDNPKMKPFKDKLSETEINSLVKYIRSLKR